MSSWAWRGVGRPAASGAQEEGWCVRRCMWVQPGALGMCGERCTRFSIAGSSTRLVQGSRLCSRASPAVLHLPCSHRALTKVPFLWQEEFRLERGPQLLALVEDAFSRQADGLQDRWLISLSKPNENDKHLLMTLAGEQGKCWEKEPSHDGGGCR